MTTITKTILSINSLDELKEAIGKHQLTGQELINRRSYLFGEWQEFEVSKDLKELLFKQIVDSLGGQKRTKESIFSSFLYGRPQHWGLNRMLFKTNRNKFSYCAGQDYTWETQQIRNALK